MQISNEDLMKVMTKIDRTQDKFIERMIGDLDHENPEARLPRLESSAKDYGLRLTSLENDRVKVITFASLISAVIGWCVHLVPTWIGKH